jgi:hypothetical protein
MGFAVRVSASFSQTPGLCERANHPAHLQLNAARPCRNRLNRGRAAIRASRPNRGTPGWARLPRSHSHLAASRGTDRRTSGCWRGARWIRLDDSRFRRNASVRPPWRCGIRPMKASVPLSGRRRSVRAPGLPAVRDGGDHGSVGGLAQPHRSCDGLFAGRPGWPMGGAQSQKELP